MEKYIYYFLTYSFLGWIIDSTFVSAKEKKIINRGFLIGPFCPIYGFGAILITQFVFPFQKNLILLFIFSVVLTSILEFFTSYFLEKLFHVTWWDYSKEQFNLQGRICLKNSLYWGILSVIFLIQIHFYIDSISNNLVKISKFYIPLLITLYFITDTIITTLSLNNLNKIIKNKISNPKINFQIKRIISSFSESHSNIHNEIINKIKNDIKKN